MSIATQISRLTSIRNSIKAKLVSLGLLQESNGGETPSTKSGTSQSGNVVVGDDLEACKQAINSINETTPYLLSSTGAKNVAGYKYAQVDTTVFEPIGSSGSIMPYARQAYLGAYGITTSAPSGSAPVLLGQVSPTGTYQGMPAASLYYDSNVIKEENIKSGVSILGISGKYGDSDYIQIENNEYDDSGGTLNSISFTLPESLIGLTFNKIISIIIMLETHVSMNSTFEVSGIFYDKNIILDGENVLYNYVYDDNLFSDTKIRVAKCDSDSVFSFSILPNNSKKKLIVSKPDTSFGDDACFTKKGRYMLFMRFL
jgi:hypothetical protein